MPQVIITPRAAQGLERCRRFLLEHNPRAALRSAHTIDQHFAVLGSDPHVGRPYAGVPELREWIIDFGDSGYVALYRYDAKADVVYILAFRHQKEMCY